MTTYYAVSSLTNWGVGYTAGWALTSGGASSGVAPTSSDDVIFDANSGSARSIAVETGGASCKTLTMLTSNAIKFDGGQITIDSAADFTSAAAGGTTTILFGNTAGATLKSAGKLAAAAQVSSQNAGQTLQLLDDLTTLRLTPGSHFDANNKNLSLGSFSMTSASTLTMGSGTWTITGANGAYVFQVGTSVTVVPGTSTLKFSNSSANTRSFDGGGKTYATLWVDVTGSGANGLSISGAYANTFSTFKASAGSTVIFAGTQTAASWLIDGTAATITLTAASPYATLVKSGGGVVYMDRVSLTNIAGSPASTFYARSSVNGGTSQITFIPGNSKFFPFF